MKYLIAASALMFAPAALAQEAQPINAQQLASCLLENTTADQEQQMKDVMVAALTDDTENLRSGVMEFGMGVLTNATTNCNVSMSQMSDPAFNQAVELYGGAIGEKIMGEAMAKLGG